LPLLRVKSVSKYFGGLAAISDLTMHVDEGEIVGLIGPNGAGKTTLFNVIAGVYKPTHGQVMYKGEDITDLRPDQTCNKGIGRTFQGSVILKEYSVLLNVMVGCYVRSQIGFLGSLFGTPITNRRQQAITSQAMEKLKLMGIDHVANQLAMNLPHGHQRKLGVTIALATNPELLLLDEPVTGMNPRETADMMAIINRLRDELGITVLLVEHDMKVVMGLCNRIVVLDFGHKIADGTPQEISSNEQVIEAYLGGKEDFT